MTITSRHANANLNSIAPTYNLSETPALIADLVLINGNLVKMQRETDRYVAKIDNLNAAVQAGERAALKTIRAIAVAKRGNMPRLALDVKTAVAAGEVMPVPFQKLTTEQLVGYAATAGIIAALPGDVAPTENVATWINLVHRVLDLPTWTKKTLDARVARCTSVTDALEFLRELVTAGKIAAAKIQAAKIAAQTDADLLLNALPILEGALKLDATDDGAAVAARIVAMLTARYAA